MSSITRDAVFLTVFIIAILGAFIVPNYINQQEDDSMQIDTDVIFETESVVEMNESTAITVNETLIKEELVINIS